MTLAESPPGHGPAHIYVDGGSHDNPGPSAIAFLIKSSDEKTTIAKKAKYIGRATNNIAEYTAVLEALSRAHELGIRTILVRSDSDLVVKQLSGRYRVKNPKLRDLYLTCKQKIEEFDKFRIEHIPRDRNKEADKMVQGVIKARLKKVSAAPKSGFKPDGIIYVAGGSKGVFGHAAAAFVIVTPDNKVLAISSRYVGARSPNIAEYAAIYLAAKKARSLGLAKLLIRSNNDLVVKQLAGQFAVKSESLKKPYSECIKALESFGKFAMQTISRDSNKVARRMVSETIKDYMREEKERKEPAKSEGNDQPEARDQ
ncbi:MAG TPA: ribonuclease HI family protein [bacterium]|nr:ribonuclease HI family protein [bacterium]